MSGLVSSLALTTVMASQLAQGIAPPPIPHIQEQTISHEQYFKEYEKNREYNLKITGRTIKALSGKEKSRNDSYLTEDAITGVDISSHQHNNGNNVNVSEIKNSGNKFAFIKATEGNGYINPYFRKDVISFIKSKTPVGFYHYARPTSNPEEAREQARFFIKVTGIDKGVKSFDPVLDIEESEGLPPDQLVAWIDNFVDEIKNLTGRDTIIYTYPSFWANQVGNSQKFNNLPLWIANYNNSTDPGNLPGGWNNWLFWQNTSKAVVPGIYKEVDSNIFNGDEAYLNSLYYSIKDKGRSSQGEIKSDGKPNESNKSNDLDKPKPPVLKLKNTVSSVQDENRNKWESEEMKSLEDTFK